MTGVQTCALPISIGKEWWTSKAAVLGAGGHDAFMQYVDTIRTRPRSYLLYNSWYDLRRREMTVERLAAAYEIMRKRLAPYGVTLAAFVPDDGWQNKQSIWEPDRSFLPQGYKPLADILEKGGTRLGLWMPLTGVNLDVPWGAKQGYEAGSKRHYCMSGPKYNRAIRAVLRDKILNWRVSYFKHDFNSFTCSQPGHGHLPEARYGFEANVDAEIGLLKALGFPPGKIMGAFVWHGWIQCLIGTLAGIGCGLLVLVNLKEIVRALSRLNVDVFPKEIYGLSEIPWSTSVGELARISIVVMVFCTIASIIPAYRAARLDPVEALRGE